MSTEITSYKHVTYIAKNFKDVLIAGTNSTFLFLGGGLEYANNDTEIIATQDSVASEKSTWDGIIAAKKIFSNEVELMLPKKTWVSGRIYKDFDDRISYANLNSDDSANNKYAMYTINSENNVYKCIYNNLESESTDEPIGDYTISDGFIETSDGYIWKYMYNVKSTNKFLTDDLIPVPYASNINTSDTEYNIDIDYIIDGSLNKIVVENSGSNYINSTLIVNSFSAGASYIQVPSLDNISVNMSITGTGIPPGAYITSTSFVYNRIYLSIPTTGTGGGVDNPIEIKTRAVILGDGNGCQLDVILDADMIHNINVTQMGTGYTYANVAIYGTGSNATARAILPPKYGHGILPAIELSAKTIMVNKKFGDIDSSEGGILPVDVKFRQYGILVNPHGYGSLDIMSSQDSDDIISQTIDITLEAGSAYTQGDYIYQGSQTNPTFYGYVLSQDYYTVRVVNSYGIPSVGLLLTNGVISRPVSSYVSPGFEKYSGDIIYTKNILPIERTMGQSEEIKLIVELQGI